MPEKTKTCPLCKGKAEKVDRPGAHGPAVMCDGERDCEWYHVLVPFVAWQNLPRRSENNEQLADKMKKDAQRLGSFVDMSVLIRWADRVKTTVQTPQQCERCQGWELYALKYNLPACPRCLRLPNTMSGPDGEPGGLWCACEVVENEFTPEGWRAHVESLRGSYENAQALAVAMLREADGIGSTDNPTAEILRVFARRVKAMVHTLPPVVYVKVKSVHEMRDGAKRLFEATTDRPKDRHLWTAVFVPSTERNESFENLMEVETENRRIRRYMQTVADFFRSPAPGDSEPMAEEVYRNAADMIERGLRPVQGKKKMMPEHPDADYDGIDAAYNAPIEALKDPDAY